MHLAFLVRDKRNSADPNAVAVVRNDFRIVGYLFEAQASKVWETARHHGGPTSSNGAEKRR